MKKLMVIAGEVSGDQHAARLVRDLRAIRPDIEITGIGGDALRAEGARTLYDVAQMTLVGFTEVVRHLPFLRRVYRHLTGLMRSDRPDALLLVDYPGFNLRLARRAHALGIPVYYYISPQVWAWNRGRIPKMARILDLLMVIFPFEVDVFRHTGLRTVFVGHPLVESVRRFLAQPRQPLPWPTGDHRIALLPGSRSQEIKHILPSMLEAARILREHHPAASFLIPSASQTTRAQIERQLAGLPPGDRASIAVLDGNMREVLRQSRAAMVCSGTATLETALIKCPMIVVYRATTLSYWIGRLLIRVPWLGMVNLIANRELCPEFIQYDARPAAMAGAIERLLADTPERQAQLEGLEEIARILEGHGDIPTAGQLVAEALN
jgi:lipid-A-disaccharide synthase